MLFGEDEGGFDEGREFLARTEEEFDEGWEFIGEDEEGFHKGREFLVRTAGFGEGKKKKKLPLLAYVDNLNYAASWNFFTEDAKYHTSYTTHAHPNIWKKASLLAVLIDIRSKAWSKIKF